MTESHASGEPVMPQGKWKQERQEGSLTYGGGTAGYTSGPVQD